MLSHNIQIAAAAAAAAAIFDAEIASEIHSLLIIDIFARTFCGSDRADKPCLVQESHFMMVPDGSLHSRCTPGAQSSI